MNDYTNCALIFEIIFDIFCVKKILFTVKINFCIKAFLLRLT